MLRIAVSASDLWGIESVSVSPDASTGAAAREMVLDPATGLYEAEFDTAKWQGADRSVVLTVSAGDTSGYLSSATLSAFVDNSAPVIAKLLPGGSHEGIVEFRFTVTDSSALSKVLFRRDGGEWKELTFRESRGAYYTLWKTTLSDNGQHVYEVRAVDALGNEKTQSFTVSIENKDYAWAIWLVLVIIVVVLVLLYVLMTRRQKREELPEGEPEPAPEQPPTPPEAKPAEEAPFRAEPIFRKEPPVKESPWIDDSAPKPAENPPATMPPMPADKKGPEPDLDKMVEELTK